MDLRDSYATSVPFLNPNFCKPAVKTFDVFGEAWIMIGVIGDSKELFLVLRKYCDYFKEKQSLIWRDKCCVTLYVYELTKNNSVEVLSGWGN